MMIKPLAMFCTSVRQVVQHEQVRDRGEDQDAEDEPISVPRPPASSVPPMITAAMASSSYWSPCVLLPVWSAHDMMAAIRSTVR